jgi:membrane protein
MATFATSETLRSGTESVNQAIQQARKTSIGQFFTAWGELRTGEGAILIAWQLLFSIFPLVVGMLALLGLVLQDPERQAAIATAIAQQFPSQASDLVSFISDVGLLWSGSNLFGTMATVFDRFYGVPDRSFLRQRQVSFAMMAVYAVLISVSVASSSITGLLVGLSEDILPFEVPNAAFAIGWLVSVTSAILMFLVLYRFVPNGRLKLWHVWKGAVLAGVSFVLLTQIFPLYLHYLGAGYAAFKALGLFLLLMTWFYFLSLILCAGALFNAVLSGHCLVRTSEQAMVEAAEKRRTRRQSQDSPGSPGSPGYKEADDEPAGPIKVLVWTGLTAAVSSLMLILARRVAGDVWRVLTRQEPPG